MLEGDRKLTVGFVQLNITRLAEAVQEGYDIVCSCPTCGFMLKHVLKEGAFYSSEYQAVVGGDEACLKIPTGKPNDNPASQMFNILKRNMYPGIFKDNGYFSTIDPMKRIMVSENTHDVGEYLANLHRSGELKTDFDAISGRMAYYPPCHLREQRIGRPYQELLNLLPGIELEPIDGSLYCCGMGGIMGFKREFHETSIHLGSRLMAKIKKVNPQHLITDCLSCRLQFNQLLPYEVCHPIEILQKAYG
jgi:glycerol-3-phosphate dehydrogenase subunit C